MLDLSQPILHIHSRGSVLLFGSGGNGNLGGISLFSNKVRLTIYGFGKACSKEIEKMLFQLPTETDSFILFV